MNFNKQKKFISAVKSNNISLVKDMIGDPEINPSGANNHLSKTAVKLGYIDVAKVLIKHESFSTKLGAGCFFDTIHDVYLKKDVQMLNYLFSEDVITKQFQNYEIRKIKIMIAELIKNKVQDF
jgi:hypothetical protein